MNCSRTLVLLAVIISQVYSLPQFITFKDGKLGVNFAGYHAGVGIGGLLGNSGTAGGLYAEAGTPFGQSARAGLDGSVGVEGGVSGRVFAGATGTDNLKVSTGLAGSVNADKSAGGGFASAQAGDRVAFSSMGGETSDQSSTGIIYTSNTNFQPLEVKPINGKVETELNIDSNNEVKPLELIPITKEVQTKVELKGDINSSVDEQVYVEQQPHVVEKHITHKHDKPRRQNFHKTAFLGGYIGPGGEIVPPAVEKTVPVSQTKIDADAQATVNADTEVNSGVDQTYTKVVTYQRNPSFFQDIFNIPISTLKAVGNLFSNTAANTNVSVQKSASVQAGESDSISVKHDPSSVSFSSAHISVETPSASKLIDDIFAIPINTLGAVNKFLENNVSGRKSIQVRQEGGEPTRVKLGPHARRRANKKVIIVQEAAKDEVEAEG